MFSRRFISAALILITAGCDASIDELRSGSPTSNTTELAADAPNDVDARLDALIEHKMSASKMKKDGAVVASSHGQKLERHPQMMLGTHCYAVLAVSEEGVRDIDVAVIDPQSEPWMRDRDLGRDATLGIRESICPNKPGLYKIEVRTKPRGKAFRYQLFSAPAF